MVKRGLKGGYLKLLSKDEIEDIHASSLEVLEQVGMHCESNLIMKIFDEGGANVDFEGNRVRIPQYLVEESLKKAPRQILLCGRDPRYDILLEDRRIYFGLGGTPTPYIRDVGTGEIKRPTKRDMAEATRLGDALPNLDFIMSIAGAFDVPYEVEYLHEFEALFNNTEKPIVYSVPGMDSARRVLKMGATISGDAESLRRRPILSLYSETASPLMFTKSNENMVEFAKAGMPITLGPMPLAGASAPVTLSGASVIGTSENLAAITLTQLINPGSPMIYAGWAGVMDPRTGRCAYGAPEFPLGANAICAQLASYYEIPCFGFGGCSDSKIPDAQAGAEAMMNLLLGALSGVNLIHDCGYLAGGSIGSMEMAVICDEIAGYVSRIVEGVKVDDESLAVDVIKSVGPCGQFLTQKHTLEFVKREIYITKLFDRTSVDSWVSRGCKRIAEVASEKVKRILREHEPKPLPKEVQERIAEIVKEARGAD